MEIEGIRQAPFNCTFMGAVRGAMDAMGLMASDAAVYGASGHGFVMNIHNQLCPSGPYCFDRAPIFGLLANLGVAVTPLGFFWGESPAEERARAEEALRAALGCGRPAMLVNMEFQLITGCDEAGFDTAQPWPGMNFPPARLSSGTWSELGGEIHMDFYLFDRSAPADPRTAAAAALRYAVGLWRAAAPDSPQPYGSGPRAWANWAEAVAAGHGGSHGAWWNGTVWGECRYMAAAYLREIAPLLPRPADAIAPAASLAEAAAILQRLAHKELPAEEKLALITQGATAEAGAIDALEALLPGLT